MYNSQPSQEVFVHYLSDLIDSYRIKDWFYLLGLSLFAIVDFYPTSSPGSCLLAILYCGHYLACGYLFNNFFDVTEDQPEKNVLVNWPRKKALSLVLFTSLSFFIFSCVVGLWLESLVVLLVSCLYSAPQSRLKDHFLASLIANVVFFSYLYFSTAKILNPAVTFADMHFLYFVAALFIPLQYLHIEEHIQERGQNYKKRPFLLTALLLLPMLTSINSKVGLGKLDVILCGVNSLFILTTYSLNEDAHRVRRLARLSCLVTGVLIFLGRP